MKLTFVIAIVFCACLLPSVGSAEMKLLLKDLKKGDTSADVKVLQQVLNQDPTTRVAATGPGSPGYETMYFGTLTEAAVKKFQEKYKAEIFSISGPVAVTGRLDVRTRTKMNTLALSGFVGENNITASKPAEEKPAVNKNFLSITSISPENPTPGETLHIYGSGFSRTSLVYVGLDNNVAFDYVDSGHVKVKIPSDADPEAPLVYIRNPLGDTRWTDPVFALITEKKIGNSGNSKMKEGLKNIEKANDGYTKVSANTIGADKTSFWSGVKEFFAPAKAYAFFSMYKFFGGSISQTYYCTCYTDFGIILDIDDKVMNSTYTTVFKPGLSTLHSNYNVYTSGPDVIGGTWDTFFQCQDTYIGPNGPYCFTSSSGGTSAQTMIDIVRGTGTSIFGSSI